MEQIPDCTQYLIEYSICTSVVLDIFQQITHTKSTVPVGTVSQGGAVPYGQATSYLTPLHAVGLCNVPIYICVYANPLHTVDRWVRTCVSVPRKGTCEVGVSSLPTAL